MNLKDFKKLGIGDLVVMKKVRAEVVQIYGGLAQVQYLRSGYKVWKKARQLRLVSRAGHWKKKEA